MDPVSGKPEFQAWSKLVTSLLVRWLNGDIVVPTPLRYRHRPFCHVCLLDADLMHTCNNEDCPKLLNNPEASP